MEFPDFSQKKILVIGDIMLDHYIHGSVDRISSEANVPIVLQHKLNYGLGGAANVALNIKNLGANVFLVGIAGTDATMDILKTMLAENHIEHLIVPDSSRSTTVKTRIIADAKHLLRVDLESTNDIADNTLDKLMMELRNHLATEKYDLLVIQDYEKGLFADRSIAKIMKLANDYELKVAVDPKEKNFFKYDNLFLFKPNLRELGVALQRHINPNIKELNLASDSIKQKISIENLVVSLGKEGIYFSNKNQSGIIKGSKRNIKDVCGAGDTVLSVLALNLVSNTLLKNASIMANLAGGIVCEREGVVSIDVNNLKEELSSHNEDN